MSTNSTSTTEPTDTTEMKIPISPTRSRELLENITQIRSRITTTLESTTSSKPPSPRRTRTASNPPRLVAVSKLKPASDILALHQPTNTTDSNETQARAQAQIHFGENYVQELLEKSRILPRTIKWHFIGGLQSNKCAQLAREVPNLWAVESVDSVKKANLLNKGRLESQSTSPPSTSTSTSTSSPSAAAPADDDDREPLRIFVQVNTSGEESKSGVAPRSDELLELCRLVRGDQCPGLRLQGLMTIGAIARSQATTEEDVNEDFVCLRENRDWVVQELGVDGAQEEPLELSMGMSEDFEGAIVQGSDEVRVGSTIFGARPPKKEAKVLEHTEDERK